MRYDAGMRRLIRPKYIVFGLLLFPVVAYWVCIFATIGAHAPPPGRALDMTPRSVTGRVLNMKTQPLEGAIVRVPGRADFATTDANGDFTLADVAPVTRMAAHKEGYW